MEPNDKPSILPIPQISRDATLYSEYVRQMLEDVDEEKKDERIVIPVKTVRGEVLSMVAALRVPASVCCLCGRGRAAEGRGGGAGLGGRVCQG
jgi:hypothetical protein